MTIIYTENADYICNKLSPTHLFLNLSCAFSKVSLRSNGDESFETARQLWCPLQDKIH